MKHQTMVCKFCEMDIDRNEPFLGGPYHRECWFRGECRRRDIQIEKLKVEVEACRQVAYDCMEKNGFDLRTTKQIIDSQIRILLEGEYK